MRLPPRPHAEVLELVDNGDLKSLDRKVVRVQIPPSALNMNILIEIIGWTGTVLVLLAYYLVTRDKIEGEDKIYLLMNLFGAICLGVNVFYWKSWPSFGLQIVWGLIAVISLVRGIRKPNK